MRSLRAEVSISQQQIDDINHALQLALRQDKARVEFKDIGDGLYEVILYPGFKGQLNDEYINELLIYEVLDELCLYAHSKYPDRKPSAILFKLSDQPSQEQVAVKIQNLPAEWVYNKQSHSLIYYINKFLHRKPKIDSEKKAISESIHQELYNSGYTVKYPRWFVKEDGKLRGVILEGETRLRTPKKVHVKQITTTEECFHAAVMAIAKACGVTVPSVKVKKTHTHCYLFSTSLNKLTAKHPETTYHYRDLMDILIDPYCLLNFDKAALHSKRQENGSFSEILPINKASIARLLLLCVIIGLSDLSPSNLGIVISESDFQKTAKLALIDFEIRGFYVVSEYFNRSLSLTENIINYFEQLTSVRSGLSFLKSCARTLTDSDYIDAFQLINQSFEEAFNDFTPEIERTMHALNFTYAIWYKDGITNDWRVNFNYMKDVVDNLSTLALKTKH